MRGIRRLTIAACAVIALAFAPACGDDSGDKSSSESSGGQSARSEALAQLKKDGEAAKQLPPATHYVGKVDGTDAFIGVTDRGGELRAYVCDSKQLGQWLAGSKTGDTYNAAAGPASLAATLGSGGAQLTGTVTLPDGSKHAFTADKATLPAGLFQAYAVDNADAISRAGWVVLANGEQRGSLKTGNIVRPAPTLSTSVTLALGGTTTAVIPAPGPVTSAKSYCSVLRDLYIQIHAIRDAKIEEGESTADQDAGLEVIYEEWGANNCGLFPVV